MKKLPLFLIFLIFVACSNKIEISKMDDFSKEFVVKFENQTTRLFVNNIKNSLNFALFNSLGSPLASKVLSEGEFKNTKFLPPNSKFDALFICVLQNLEKKSFECRAKDTKFEVKNAK